MSMELLGFTASFAMGITLGLLGAGGSILTIPILVYLFSLPPTIAAGYSLFVVGTTALIGSGLYVRKGDIDFKAGLVFAIPSVIGVNLSRGYIIPQIPTVVAQVGSFVLTKEILVMVTFATLMVVASYSMIKKKAGQNSPRVNRPVTRVVLMAFVGLFVGLIAGFVGAGGGFLIIPALVFMAGLSMRTAVGTSLMTIAVQSLLGFAGDISRGLLVDWALLAEVVALAVIGIIVGSAFTHKINEEKMRPAFGWFILFMGTVISVEQLLQLLS